MSEPPPDPAPRRALDGVRVLDLSRVLAGPWATQLLADLGADVIKVEHPRGDDTRRWGPPFLDVAGDRDDLADAAYFLAANRNKRAIALDFSRPAGAAAVRRLAAQSDIVVENFKVGGLAKYGLDYGSMAALKPSLVYCSITGFGQTGPYAALAGYDYVIQALGGLLSITGAPDGDPGNGPVKVGVAVADLFAGMYAGASILAALRHAERTGEGQHLDVALLDCQLAMLANQATNYLVSGAAPRRLGNSHPNIAPYDAFDAADGKLIVAVGNDAQFRAFAKAIDRADLAGDPRFATNADRVANRDALLKALGPELAARTRGDWLKTFAALGVPAGPVNGVDEAFADPQAVAREAWITLTRPDGAACPTPLNPVKFSKTPAVAERAPPALGADTREVLREALSEAEIDELFVGGIAAGR
ncbi:MAG: CaiB/BaiF CoA transferase family protein [Parvularculaceae bacterium]